MKEVKIFSDIKEGGLIWAVLVQDDNEKKEPTVAFYDCRHEFTNYGQFVSRYYADTLLKDINLVEGNVGLNLDGGIECWSVSGPTMKRVLEWVRQVSDTGDTLELTLDQVFDYGVRASMEDDPDPIFNRLVDDTMDKYGYKYLKIGNLTMNRGENYYRCIKNWMET